MKLVFLATVMVLLSASAQAGFLDDVIPTIVNEFYSFASSYKEGYRFKVDEPNGSKREEVGIIMNPGTDHEELVVMGSYTSYDEKTDIETTVVYTADKEGYKPRPMFKNRKLATNTLKTCSG